jgi:hypothetical protein
MDHQILSNGVFLPAIAASITAELEWRRRKMLV